MHSNNNTLRVLLTATLLALPVAACDGPEAKSAPGDADKAKTDTKTADADADAKIAKAMEAAKPKDTRVLADSGLGIGGKFKAFDILNCDTGDEYCQVCKYGSNPKIMAVGTLDDPGFKTDLQNLDALVAKYGPEKIKAFAVVTDIKDGKSATPLQDREALQAKVKAMREELRLAMPVVIPAAKDGKANEVFDGYYNITKSRTVMFADGRNKVKYSAVAPSDLAGLNTAIQEVIGAATPPADKQG